MRRAITLLLLTAPVLAHGGQFTPPPTPAPPSYPRGTGGGVPPGNPPGLPGTPSRPARTGNVTHTWIDWWSYNQLRYLDFRRRQAERRGPVTGEGATNDPEAWRDRLRERLVPLLREALRDDDKEVRTAAAVALGKLQAREAVPDLKRLIETDSVKEGREAALLGLVLLADEGLREYFVAIAERQGEEHRLRGFALMGIGRIGDAEALDYLGALFGKSERAAAILPNSTGDRRQFRIAALAGLLLSGKSATAARFLDVARDRRFDDDVRAYAVTCLGKLRAEVAVPDLAAFLKRDPSDQVRRSAAVALGSMASPADAFVVRALTRASRRDKDKVVRHFSIMGLGQIGGPEICETLKRDHPQANKETRGFYVLALGLCGREEAVPVLRAVLEESADKTDAAAAAVAFGLLGDRAQAPLVRKSCERAKDWLLLRTTVLTLGILNDLGAVERVQELLVEKREPQLRTSAALAYALLRQHTAVPLFLDLLHGSSSVLTQKALTQVLAYLPSPAAAEPLLEIYRNEKLQRVVRAYAIVALGTIADRSHFPTFLALGFDTNYFVRCDPLDEAFTIL